MNMKKIFLLSMLFVSPCILKAQNAFPDEFTRLMEQAEMTFTIPDGFEVIDSINNPQLKYEFAIKHKKGKLEARYAIRPTDATMKGKNIEEMTFMPIAMNLTGIMEPGKLKIQKMPDESVKKEFNAEGGTTVLLDKAHKEFMQKYKQCMYISVWRKDIGSAHIFLLFNEMNNKELMDSMMKAFYALKFKEKEK